MKIYFLNSLGIERLIGERDTERECYKVVQEFLTEHKYKSYYTRSWKDESNEKRIILDVGSHTEFFILEND